MSISLHSGMVLLHSGVIAAHPFDQTAAVSEFHPSFFQAGLQNHLGIIVDLDVSWLRIPSHLIVNPVPGSPMASSGASNDEFSAWWLGFLVSRS